MALHVDADGTLKEGPSQDDIPPPDPLEAKLLAVCLTEGDHREHGVALIAALVIFAKAHGMPLHELQRLVAMGWNTCPDAGVPYILSRAVAIQARALIAVEELKKKGLLS